MDSAKRTKEIIDPTEKLEHRKRTNTIIIVEILLRPEQINPFKKRLEDLKREFMSYEDDRNGSEN